MARIRHVHRIVLIVSLLILLVIGAGVFILFHSSSQKSVSGSTSQIAGDSPQLPDVNAQNVKQGPSADSPSGKSVQDTTVPAGVASNPPAIPVDPNSQQAEAEKIAAQNTVLLAQAEKEHVVVTDADVNDAIDKALLAYGITKDTLVQKLASSGITFDQYKAALKTQLTVSTVVANHVDLKSLTVSDAEVEAYYQQHISEFSDFQDNPDALVALKQKIKMTLLKNKQTDAIQAYIDGVTK